MAYVAPVTVSPGQIATASLWNQDVRDNVADLNSRMNLSTQLSGAILTVTGSGSLTNSGNATVLMLDLNGAYNIYGLALPPRDPFAVYIVNISANAATLKHESGSEATPSKRFFLPASTDLVLNTGEGTTLLHVSPPVGTRWLSVVK